MIFYDSVRSGFRLFSDFSAWLQTTVQTKISLYKKILEKNAFSTTNTTLSSESTITNMQEATFLWVKLNFHKVLKTF